MLGVVHLWLLQVVWIERYIGGIRYKVIGREHVPKGACIIASKHQSAWETLAFPALMPRPLCYVFKRELLYVPFFGWALGMLKMIHINRKEGKNAFVSVIRAVPSRLVIACVVSNDQSVKLFEVWMSYCRLRPPRRVN